MDLALAIPAVLIAAPIVLVAAIVIKIVDWGPAFYAQERVGLHGEVFRLWKVRTMYVDADRRLASFLKKHPERRSEWERFYKLEDDPRVIPIVGDIMRRTSIDELPNLLNVLRGELSIVGPRPFPPYHLDAFGKTFRERRASVRPGITGLWQIERGDLDAQERADTYYVDNWSIRLDCKIVLKTIPAVLLVRKKHH
jgi:lipopolysaccharide/colanic/teichoic acid biosynthesis glycosyltransferase